MFTRTVVEEIVMGRRFHIGSSRHRVVGHVGIGPSQEIQSHGVPCEYCDLKSCVQQRGYT